MSEKYNQEKFFNSTLSKLESDLTKFIFQTNFSNVQSIYLREEISRFKNKSFNRSNSQQILNNIRPNLNMEKEADYNFGTNVYFYNDKEKIIKDSMYFDKSQNIYSISQRNINIKLKLDDYYDNSAIKTNKNHKDKHSSFCMRDWNNIAFPGYF